jgi:hypothetical protein
MMLITFDALEAIEGRLFTLFNQHDWYTAPGPMALWANFSQLTAEYSKAINSILRMYPEEEDSAMRMAIKVRIKYAESLLRQLVKCLRIYEATGQCAPERFIHIQDFIKRRRALLAEFYAPIVVEEERIFNDSEFRNHLNSVITKRAESTA